uniref:Beta-ketoacyl synthase N-terminal domain-containing protein n=1 Tax=Romanomermis culicivorax TaxID=13658 RepID=A0A915L0Z2_ROMCU
MKVENFNNNVAANSQNVNNNCHLNGDANHCSPYWIDQDEVVISGISCRLPESDNMNEFKDHLVNGDDMVTKDDRRWEPVQKNSAHLEFQVVESRPFFQFSMSPTFGKSSFFLISLSK